MGACRPNFNFKLTGESTPPVINDFIESVSDIGGGLSQVMSHDGANLTSLDPTLFTSPSAGATGVSISNVPVSYTLIWDNPVAAGDTWAFAGAPGFDPGSGTVT